MAALIDSGEIKQIIVVTDGRSGSGTSPVEAARQAYDAGITVSTIGIISIGGSREKEIQEAEEIAKAGGGLCEYSHIEDLSGAMQDLACKAARRTIEQTVYRQLKIIMGEEIDDLEPVSRTRIIDFIENYGENINLKCIIVFDIGESTKGRLAIVKRSIMELLENLRIRKGRSSIAVIGCSGGNAGMSSIICDFTSEISILRQKLEMMCPGEDMPVGPAIFRACELMQRYYEVCYCDISG